MKLTNYHRDAFIKSVMHDVPSVDLLDDVTELLDQDVIAQLPLKVRELLDDKVLQKYIGCDLRRFSHANEGVYHLMIGELMPREPALKKAAALIDKHVAAEKKRDALRTKLRSVVYGCTTRKALAAALPEFEKYLPVEPAPRNDRNLPVVANVVSDFVKAGWPKDKAAA